jgi:hypothetical protein
MLPIGHSPENCLERIAAASMIITSHLLRHPIRFQAPVADWQTAVYTIQSTSLRTLYANTLNKAPNGLVLIDSSATSRFAGTAHLALYRRRTGCDHGMAPQRQVE